jgi:hypothetical protein
MKLPIKITPKLAEETGWHIGDGSMNFYNQYKKKKGFYQLRGHIKDDKEHYIKIVKPLFKSLYDLDINLREMPSTRVFGFQIWNSELIKFKQNIGLPLGKKYEIKIPKIFLSNKELKLSIIKGIFDTDGGIYLENKNNKLYPRLYISTISYSLSEQLLNLLNNLSIRTTRYKESSKRISNRRELFIVSIRGEEMFHRFMKIIQPANPKHIRKYLSYKESFK